MLPKIVSAFVCSICETVFLEEKDCIACISRCEMKREEKARRAREKRRFEKTVNALRLKAEGFWDISTLLEERAQEVGYELHITDLSGKIKMLTATHDQPIGKPRHCWNKAREGTKEEQELYHQSTTYPAFCGRIRGSFSATNRSPKDRGGLWGVSGFFEKYCRGIHTGTGGGGDNNFQYEIRMFVDDFPKIKEKYDRYLKLKVLDTQFQSERKRLEEEYKEYLKWKIFSDISWAVHNQELKELREREQELLKILEGRKVELDNEKNEKVNPSLPEGYDRKEYSLLESMFE